MTQWFLNDDAGYVAWLAAHDEGFVLNTYAHIAAGFENIMVETKTGTWVAGLIKSEDNENLVINSPEDGLVTIPVADAKTRQRGASGMPDGMGQILSRQNLRDLLAYLSTLK